MKNIAEFMMYLFFTSFFLGLSIGITSVVIIGVVEVIKKFKKR